MELPLRSLFEAPTVARLAAVVDAARTGAGHAEPGPALSRVDRDGPLPLSFGQERLWFLDQLAPAQATYNIPALVELRGELDVDALRPRLEQTLARHEALRTTFTMRDGRPVQVVAAPGALELRAHRSRGGAGGRAARAGPGAGARSRC